MHGFLGCVHIGGYSAHNSGLGVAMKIMEKVTLNKKAQRIIDHSRRKQMIIEAEETLKKEKK